MRCASCTLLRRFHVPRDVDYVQAFQDLAALQLDVRHNGPSTERWLRRAELERDVGNHHASLRAAVEAHRLDPANPEPHYHVGVALVLLAMQKALLVPLTPASCAPATDVETLLEEARGAFVKVLQLNPADQDAEDHVHDVDALRVAAFRLGHNHA